MRLIQILPYEPKYKFQFTHPGKGATLPDIYHVAKGGFNSRTLGRVRQQQTVFGRHIYDVSIHAPWEGCDETIWFDKLRSFWFQFTHPGKGATATEA